MLYTIGHSAHPIERFLALLTAHAITAIADVRSHPVSRRHPQFNREALKPALAERGIHYVFLGQELGARSTDPADYENGVVQYHRLATRPAFREGIERLLKGMQAQRIALMCAEGEPLGCHRTILVCRELRKQGAAITHILPDGALLPHAELEQGLLHAAGLKPDLLRGASDCLEDAYDAQAARIAYRRPDSG